MEELIEYKTDEAQVLLSQVKNFMQSIGIMLREKPIDDKNPQIQSEDIGGDWIKPFIIQTDTPAFYLDINSSEDISRINSDIERRLTNLQIKLKDFLSINSDLDSVIANKIESLSKHLITAKKGFKFNTIKKISNEIKDCNSIEEMRDKVRSRYGDFLDKEILERIMIPLYEGLRQTPNKSEYLYVLNQVNDFLSELGVVTVDISLGSIWDFENSAYNPSEESKSEKYSTANEQEKDMIREILRYAYAFQEDKVTENPVIKEGEIIVMVYRQGGAQ